MHRDSLKGTFTFNGNLFSFVSTGVPSSPSHLNLSRYFMLYIIVQIVKVSDVWNFHLCNFIPLTCTHKQRWWGRGPLDRMIIDPIVS